MFKASDGKGCTPFDLGYKVGKEKEKDVPYNPYDEETDAFQEYEDGFYSAQDDEEYFS